ncbi:cytochrome c oxidase assembly protein [Saccharibacillus qingshengii]|uniref:cytochrome c oxidase assembly protein n=1 Tax=Saccharibacillus qingshengii TaxID=1763540 RepID=UPI001FEA025A|nr:cytochrome c oxidase assembly protein [Saccharibacillus qingshengii]
MNHLEETVNLQTVHSMHNHGAGSSGFDAGFGIPGGLTDMLPLLLAAVLPIAAYLTAVVLTNRRYKRWPIRRSLLGCTGILLSAAAVAGPLAEASHHNFTLHMLGHLLLGMLGPLLIVLSAPAALLLRSLPRRQARMLSLLLRSRAAAFLTHPITASVLNMGGLWLLYATGLFAAMHTSPILYALVHLHVFAAGYLFTAALIPVDPAPHRTSFPLRAAVMIAAFASHGILGKFLYAYPPAGVVPEDAKRGAQLMYYGGDAVDLLLILLFCSAWYRQSARTYLRSSPTVLQDGYRRSVRNPGKEGIHD